jgi:putative restriction endonuclease
MHDPQKIWLHKLRKLNPNVSVRKGSGAARFAPHKPLLLLAIIDLAEAAGPSGLELRIGVGAALRVRFLESWAIVFRRWDTKPEISLPFYHLSNQGFWKPFTAAGAMASDPHSTTIIELNSGFAGLLALDNFRELARHVLIQTWFPPDEQAGLYALYGEKPDDGALKTALDKEATAEATAKGRDARFRVQVVTQYIYTCALTGYTLTTAQGATIVEAAHIADFATSRDNDPRNGLALTPDAHWTFDEQLWTVDEDLRVVVSKHGFSDRSPEGQCLAALHGRPLFFHARASLRPEETYLAKHREKFSSCRL